VKLILENFREFLNENEEDLTEVSRWKSELARLGHAGPYRLESGEMGDAVAVLEQYVVPDGQKPTHFIHFGGIEEQDVTAVMRDVEVPEEPGRPGYRTHQADPKLGPAKYVSAHARKSRHGPQFKFGLNPKQIYNTPHGIYSYPLTKRILSDLKLGQLPFAQNEPYILLFKPNENLPVIYTSEDIPEDEYKEYINKLFSDEILEGEKEAWRKKSPGVLDDATPTNVKYIYYAIKELEEVKQKHGDDWQPEDIPRVRSAEHESRQHLATHAALAGAPTTRSGYLWNLLRMASDGDSIRWNILYRKLGIGGVVDDVATGHIHQNEPLQAVFFSVRDPDINLELVEVLPNTQTKEKIKTRKFQTQIRELRETIISIVKGIHPDSGFRVDQAFIDAALNHIDTDPDSDAWLWDVYKDKSRYENATAILETKGRRIIFEYFVRSYAAGSTTEISSAYNDWKSHAWDQHRDPKQRINLPSWKVIRVMELIDNHEATKFHHQTLQSMVNYKEYGLDNEEFDKAAISDEGLKGLLQDRFNAMDESVRTHAEFMENSKVPIEEPEEVPTVPMQESKNLNYLGSKWDWMTE